MATTELEVPGVRPLLAYRLLRQAGELVLVALSFLLYFVVRAHVIGRAGEAIANARRIVDLEKALSLFEEPSLQAWALAHAPAVRIFDFAYFWLDFPLIAAVGLVMYARRRPAYTFARDAILFSGLMALVAYALFPVAPPRLLPEIGVVDTLQRFSNLSYQAQSTSFFVNPYAAMPSLHVGWAMLLSIGVIRAWGRNRLVLALALLHPISQWASTVFTGNHYFLDGVGGLGAAALGLAYATAMERWGYGKARRLLRLGASYEDIR